MGLNDIDDSKEGIAKFLKRNPKTCFIGILDDELVGVILAGHDGRRGYIYHLCVVPEFRHNGIATDLVGTAINALRREGLHLSFLKITMVVMDFGNIWDSLHAPTLFIEIRN